MKPYFYVLISFFSLLLHLPGAADDLEILRQRVVKEEMLPQVSYFRIMNLMESMREDGTWPGIDYGDVSRTGFQHGEHLSNMVILSRAYKKQGSKFKGDKKLKQVIYSSLDFWLANDFISDNWWWNQIGTPDALISFLFIMDNDLTGEQIAKALPMVDRASLDASGARPSGDRIKIAGILAKTALFNRDTALFDEVIKVIEGEIKFTSGRGMQYDYSFHHRVDRVNNTLSYGTGYADSFAEWTSFVSGTTYKFSDESVRMLTDYYLDGICKMMVYGKYPDPGAKNRSITRPGALNAFRSSTPERLMNSSGYRKNELQEIVNIRNSVAKATLSFSKFFWQSEHYTQQRPGYFTSVRMYSSRNYNMEQPYNSEGLMNHHRGDGTNYISRTGREYSDISPVYDWQKIPGATIVQKPSLPPETEIQKKGLTDFAGAVTDGLYGAATFDFISPHDPLVAKKAWFFFDNEYICLGTGITSSSNLAVVTTLNQCLLRGGVSVKSEDKISTLSKGFHELKEVKWIIHDNIGYLFPVPSSVNLSNQSASGSWYGINHQSDSPKDKVVKDVFKLWIDHGQQPENSTYQYIIVPSTSLQEMSDNAETRNIRIIKNTADIQAVTHTELNISQIVFYTAGEINISDDLMLRIASPGLVMIKSDGRKIKSISVSDPARKLDKIHLTVSVRLAGKGDNYTSSWSEKEQTSEISIDLPRDVYAGKSVTIDF